MAYFVDCSKNDFSIYESTVDDAVRHSRGVGIVAGPFETIFDAVRHAQGVGPGPMSNFELDLAIGQGLPEILKWCNDLAARIETIGRFKLRAMFVRAMEQRPCRLSMKFSVWKQ